MKSIALASLALAVALTTAACGKGGDASSSATTAAAAPANTAAATGKAGAAAATGAATGAAAGDKPVLGTCNDKSANVCREYYGVLPLLAEDLCKGIEGKGVLTKGSTPCVKDNLLGQCEIKGDEASEVWYYYKQPGLTDDMQKTACEILGKWTPAKGGAAGAASGAAAAAPAATGAAKAAAPAAPAKAAPKKKR